MSAMIEPQSVIGEVITRQEIAAWRAELAGILGRLNDSLAVLPELPSDAQEAVAARLAAQARGFYVVREFAAVIGRAPQWVSDRCAARVIRTLRGGKPYRIPLDEERRWNAEAGGGKKT